MMTLHNLMHHIKKKYFQNLVTNTNDGPSQKNLVTNTNDDHASHKKMYATSLRDANKNGMEQKYRTKNCKYC